jgi:hypothetical protein
LYHYISDAGVLRTTGSAPPHSTAGNSQSFVELMAEHRAQKERLGFVVFFWN